MKMTSPPRTPSPIDVGQLADDGHGDRAGEHGGGGEPRVVVHPTSSATMRGIAGPTIVWLIEATSMPSMRAVKIRRATGIEPGGRASRFPRSVQALTFEAWENGTRILHPLQLHLLHETHNMRTWSNRTADCGERKKRETRRAIHRAALDLVEESGFDAVTTDQIAGRAGVSPRTFFNYFPTKEAAVLGTTAPTLTN